MTILPIGIGLALVVAGGGAPSRAAEHKYVGVAKCRSCHKKELIGDQYDAWKKGPHAKALEALKGEDAARIAAQKGLSTPAHEAPECLKCHVTAYGAPATAFAKKPLAASDGVQCESCHGPGNDYKSKKTMSNFEKAVAKGLWQPGKDAKICTACHNADSPTWNAAEGFDFEAAKRKIAHPIPKDVKGKYTEVSKQRGGRDDEEEAEEE